jgi:hypothetical protein
MIEVTRQIKRKLNTVLSGIDATASQQGVADD